MQTLSQRLTAIEVANCGVHQTVKLQAIKGVETGQFKRAICKVDLQQYKFVLSRYIALRLSPACPLLVCQFSLRPE